MKHFFSTCLNLIFCSLFHLELSQAVKWENKREIFPCLDIYKPGLSSENTAEGLMLWVIGSYNSCRGCKRSLFISLLSMLSFEHTVPVI